MAHVGSANGDVAEDGEGTKMFKDVPEDDMRHEHAINGKEKGIPPNIELQHARLSGVARPPITSPMSPIEPRVYKRRWFMLAVFCLVSMTNAAQWIQYSIIGNVIRDFYSVGYLAVDWLSMIYMLAYIPLIWPATWLLEQHEGGLKVIGVLGASLNCAGAWLRYAGATPDTFFLAFLGQAVCSVAQVFILGMPAHVAATWFGAKEVSTACALGVFGNQVGVALGFVLPPILVPNDDNKSQNMLNMFLGMACITTVLLVLIFAVYQDKPPVPPSRAKLGAQISRTQRSYTDSIKSLCRNTGFMLLVVTYGINVGSFYAISTLLNQLILTEFADKEVMAGVIGLTIVLTGLVGSAVTGVWLDKTRTYRGTTVVVYILSLLGLIGFTFTLKLGNIWIVFAISAFLGFFMTGYLPLGFEFAAELTHPEPEGTSSGMLNASAQTFGIVFTLSMGKIVTDFGTYGGNLFLCAAMVIGCILTMFIKSNLRRQEAERMHDFQAIPTEIDEKQKEAELSTHV
ncbi:choline/ethanolamine transporter flvcr2a-like isoform X1 [Asterias amurensis]|uniref:choline/ethanolamine transporter flvcr2a-like isoform X1 n=1 Tax=Asterias amurensis TaxID=7602 RepID=UPI003AB415FA